MKKNNSVSFECAIYHLTLILLHNNFKQEALSSQSATQINEVFSVSLSALEHNVSFRQMFTKVHNIITGASASIHPTPVGV